MVGLWGRGGVNNRKRVLSVVHQLDRKERTSHLHHRQGGRGLGRLGHDGRRCPLPGAASRRVRHVVHSSRGGGRQSGDCFM